MEELNYKKGGLNINAENMSAFGPKWIPKYRIEKFSHWHDTDSRDVMAPRHPIYKPVDKEAIYFVLRVDKDPHSKIALKAYVDSIKDVNPQLANDMTEQYQLNQ